jgi:hypothetical protein
MISRIFTTGGEYSNVCPTISVDARAAGDPDQLLGLGGRRR